MSALLSDERLALEARFRLRQIEEESQELTVEQLRQCLLMAWHGWLLERTYTQRLLEAHGIDLMVRMSGYTPGELFGATVAPRED